MFFNARWYDPSPGRFGQADSIIPGAGDPLAFDRYSYVRNNPINGIDLSGHFHCIGAGANSICTMDEPSYVHVLATSNVTYAQDRRRQTFGSQYDKLSNGEQSYNLCGHISVEIIAEALSGKKVGLAGIFEENDTPDPIGSDALKKLISDVIPDAVVFVGYDGEASTEKITEAMQSGYYVIALVRVDTSTGKLIAQNFSTSYVNSQEETICPDCANHWVVIKTITEEGVYVVNPFNNDIEYYTNAEFSATFGGTYLGVRKKTNYDGSPSFSRNKDTPTLFID